MSFYKSNGIIINGMTCVVPKNRVTVESFSNVFGEEIPAKFSTVTGIKQCTRLSNKLPAI